MAKRRSFGVGCHQYTGAKDLLGTRRSLEDTTGAKVLAQWERMKQTIASDPQLSRMEFNVLWPRMLSRSGFVKQFSLVLRIVGIAVTFTVDTSGCERLISLMNDLKPKFQERMGHEYLRDLVPWHKSKRLLSHAEWEAALGRTLVRWSQAGHRRHQVHTHGHQTQSSW